MVKGKTEEKKQFPFRTWKEKISLHPPAPLPRLEVSLFFSRMTFKAVTNRTNAKEEEEEEVVTHFFFPSSSLLRWMDR